MSVQITLFVHYAQEHTISFLYVFHKHLTYPTNPADKDLEVLC